MTDNHVHMSLDEYMHYDKFAMSDRACTYVQVLALILESAKYAFEDHTFCTSRHFGRPVTGPWPSSVTPLHWSERQWAACPTSMFRRLTLDRHKWDQQWRRRLFVQDREQCDQRHHWESRWHRTLAKQKPSEAIIIRSRVAPRGTVQIQLCEWIRKLQKSSWKLMLCKKQLNDIPGHCQVSHLFWRT